MSIFMCIIILCAREYWERVSHQDEEHILNEVKELMLDLRQFR